MKKASSLICLLLGLAVAFSASDSAAQKKKKKRNRENELQKQAEQALKDNPTADEKIELLTEDLEKAQQALRKELEKQLGNSLNQKAATTDQAEKSLVKGVAKQIKKAEQALEAAIKKNGADSKQARRAKKRLANLREEAEVLNDDPSAGGNALDTAKLYKREFGGDLPDFPGTSVDDLADQGERLIIRGNDLKMVALAAKIRNCKDPKKKEALKKELTELAKQAEVARKKFREKMISELEARLKELRDQGEAGSADDVVNRLLDTKKDKKEEKKDEKKPAPKKAPAKAKK